MSVTDNGLWNIVDGTGRQYVTGQGLEGCKTACAVDANCVGYETSDSTGGGGGNQCYWYTTTVSLPRIAAKFRQADGRAQYAASKCIDGLFDTQGICTHCYSGSCEITFDASYDDNPWFQIDMGAAYDVSYLRIWSGQEFSSTCCASGLSGGDASNVGNVPHNILIGDTDSSPETATTSCQHQAVYGTGPWDEACVGTGRYVWIQILKDDHQFQLQEVEIYGSTGTTMPWPSLPPAVQQSPVYGTNGWCYRKRAPGRARGTAST